MNTKDAYKKKIEAEVDLAQAKLDELKAQAKSSAADVGIKFDKLTDDLENKLQTTKTKLRELESASENAWEQLKDGVEAAWDDLKSGLKNAAAKLKH